MKKILTIIGAIIVLSVVISVLSAIASCLGCDGCNGCDGCSSCNSCNSCDDNKGGNHTYTPPAPTEYFYLYANDGTDDVYTVATTATSINSEYITREGYTFLGVYSATIGGEMYFNSSNSRTMSPQKDEQLYIRWEVNSYKLVFTVGDAQLSVINDVTYGTVLPLYPVPLEVPAGKRFEGWKDAKGNLVSDENGQSLSDVLTGEYYTLDSADKSIKLTASFIDIKYKVTYDYGELGEDTSVEVAPATVITPPAVTVTGNYEFLGWSYDEPTVTNPRYYDGEPISADTTLHAIILKYKDIPLMDGDKVLKTERVYDNGTPLVLNTVELELKEGYEVAGWYTSETMSGSSRINSVVYATPYTALYADVQPITYTATLVLGTGETCTPTTVSFTVESEADLPSASKTNYTFVGWCTDDKLTAKPITKIAAGTLGNVSLYPKFKGVDVEFTLNTRGGTVSDNLVKVEYGSSYTLPVPRRDGYLFLGWFDSLSGGEKYTDGKGASLAPLDSTEEIPLYAQWAQKYTVNVTVTPASAGEVEVEEYYIEGDEVTLSFAVPTGYNMVGWVEDEVTVSYAEIYTFTMPAKDVEITLRLVAKKYTVTLDCADYAEDGEIKQVTYGEAFTLPVLEKPAYKFIGWYYGKTLITDGEGKSLKNWNVNKNVTVSPQFAALDETNGKLIYDVDTLRAVKNDPAAKYQLVFDVDMEGETWTPFAFSGTIVGNNHSILNLTVSPSAVGHTGMFSTLSGTVQDINFENLNVTLTATDYTNVYAVGGVCGVLTGTLTNVTVKSGEIVGGTTYNYAGGLVGSMTGGTLKNCKNYASVTSAHDNGAGGIAARFTGGTLTENENYGEINGTTNVGGIVGYIGLGGTFSILSLTNAGEINGTTNVGGIAGYIYDYRHTGYNNGSYTLTMTNMNNSGTISGTTYVGGVLGRLNVFAEHSGSYTSLIKLTASLWANTGDITGTSYVGGLIGLGYSNDGASEIQNSSSSGTITGVQATDGWYVGGFAGRLDNISIVNGTNAGTTIVANSFHLDGTTRLAYVGGYAGYGYAFTGCENASNITYTARGNYVGGIAGFANHALNSCTNTGTITATESNYVGGLAGHTSLSGNYSFITLTNTGDVKGANNVGGIIGYIYDYRHTGYNNGSYTLTMTNINNSGKITGVANVGGILGRLNVFAEHSGSYTSIIKITASQWTDTGDVTGTSYVGGLIGLAYSNDSGSTITGSSVSAKITGGYYVGGFGGRFENIRIVEGSNANTTITANGFVLDNTTRLAYVGGYAGFGYMFSNCENASDITYTEKGNYVGGIAGYAHGVISDCTNTGKITATESNYVGGIAGYIGLSGTATITGLTNGGAISGNDNVGGIIGYLYDYRHTGYNNGNFTVTITRLNNSGAVSGRTNVGGTIGRANVYAEHNGSYTSVIKITASFIENSGNVTGTSNVGGLMGNVSTNDGSSTIMEYTQTGTVNGTGENVDKLIGLKSNISFKD